MQVILPFADQQIPAVRQARRLFYCADFHIGGKATDVLLNALRATVDFCLHSGVQLLLIAGDFIEAEGGKLCSYQAFHD